MDRDLHLTDFGNQKVGSTKCVDKYLLEKAKISNNINFGKSIKNLANIDGKLNIFIGDYKPKIDRTTKSIFKLNYKKYKPQKLKKVLRKYLKPSKSVAEIEDQFEELKNI